MLITKSKSLVLLPGFPDVAGFLGPQNKFFFPRFMGVDFQVFEADKIIFGILRVQILDPATRISRSARNFRPPEQSFCSLFSWVSIFWFLRTLNLFLAFKRPNLRSCCQDLQKCLEFHAFRTKFQILKCFRTKFLFNQAGSNPVIRFL